MGVWTQAVDEHASRALVIVVPTIVTTVIAVILTLLRLYVRKFVMRTLAWDDWFNVLATLTTLVAMALILAAVRYGLGHHIDSLDMDRAVYCVKLLRMCLFPLLFSTIFLKISISLLLMRLFLTTKIWKIFFWCFIAFNTITSILDAAIVLPQCSPVARAWDKRVDGTCWPKTAINGAAIAQGSIAAGTDIVLSILPIVFLWRVKIPIKVKGAICGLMALGFASAGFSLARTILVSTLTESTDPTWDYVNLYMCAFLESSIGVIAAAAPSTRPLLRPNFWNKEYSRSRSRSLPLHTVTAKKIPGRVWGDTLFDTRFDPEERPCGSRDSQTGLWPQLSMAIMKRTSIEVVTNEVVTSEVKVVRGE
ncbi:hypothetical protein BO94DRAFT_454308 [Aspergillus sclerotioniger CBS 115572]|uniref:Rhodopsin domain-containing protein n=1 Tax=Aspergillus sclerotioniger CBS 115572 TaxID=1450535 RepID=A0A317XC78_9EURO|nr:hypothetical protein BO94DRAFT_454308 [Aspergillus sclerotioniger CBS 115572]PWY96143.1 hypothetical protein BO94DRAFT_454308 [Aspergillus sclerotioniger CBS 115572]